VCEVAERDGIGKNQNDPEVTSVSGCPDPGNGSDQEARRDTLQQDLGRCLVEESAGHLDHRREKLPPHKTAEDVQGRCCTRTEHVGDEYDAPKARDLTQLAPCRIGSQGKHTDDGLLGEELHAS